MNTYSNLDEFTSAYVNAALWTNNPNVPGGVDYEECGVAEHNGRKLSQSWIEQAIIDCNKFQAENEAFLKKAGYESQNGHDFWFTRNHLGVGFWEGYTDEVGNVLTKAAHSFGKRYLDWDCDII